MIVNKVFVSTLISYINILTKKLSLINFGTDMKNHFLINTLFAYTAEVLNTGR